MKFSSSRFGALAAWAGTLLKLGSRVAGLFLCLLLLLIVSFTGHRIRDGRTQLKINFKPEAISNEVWSVEGEAPPGTFIVADLSGRIVDTEQTTRDGRFVFFFPEPRPLSGFRFRAYDADSRRIVAITQLPPADSVSPDAPPTLSLAYHIRDLGRLWVAGEYKTADGLQLETASGEPIGSIDATFSSGFFDQIIPYAGSNAPTAVIVRTISDNSVTSAPMSVQSLDSWQLPLARRADIVVTSTNASIALEVRVPVAHPGFLRLVQGAQGNFIYRLFGAFNGRFYPETDRPSITITGDVGIVRSVYRSDSFISSFALRPNSDERSSGACLLLSTQDVVRVRFHGPLPSWVDPPLPSALSSSNMVWSGPAESPAYLPLRFGYGNEDVLESISLSARQNLAWAEPSNSETEPEKAQRFLASLERRGQGNVLRLTWRLFVQLIPYIGLLWLARTAPIGSARLWRPLIAATLILAFCRSWYYFWYLLFSEPGRCLRGAVIPSMSMLPAEGGDWNSYMDLFGKTFWLTFAFLVACVPLYFSSVTRFAAGPPAPGLKTSGGRWKKLRRGFTVVRVFYGLIVLAALLYCVRKNTHGSLVLPGDLLEQLKVLLSGQVDRFTLERMIPMVLLSLLLMAFGLRPALFGAALILVSLHWSLLFQPQPADGTPSELTNVLDSFPWGITWLLLVLTGWFWMAGLLRTLLPGARNRRWLSWLLPPGLLAAGLCMLVVSTKTFLITLGALITIGTGWIAVHGACAREPFARRARRSPFLFFVALAATGVALGWPFPGPEGETMAFGLGAFSLGYLVYLLNDLVVFFLGLGVILRLRKHAERNPGVIIDYGLQAAGVYLFAVFLIRSSATWVYIPIPFLIGWLLARYGLFRHAGDRSQLRDALEAVRMNPRLYIAHVLNHAEASEQFASINKALDAKLAKAELKPEQHHQELASYYGYLADKLKPMQAAPGLTARDVAFAVGEPNVLNNTLAALKTGALLALAPLAIALIQYLPTRGPAYPYPVADFIVFAFWAIASWILYALFFGFFYAQLRGRNGLVKGFVFFLALTVPFASLRLLTAESRHEWQEFMLWATQIFLFCTLLGLLAGDLRLLRRNGFEWRDLKRVHNLPTLSAYASTVLAAIIPAAIAVLTGRVTDIVKFFLETILPKTSGSG